MADNENYANQIQGTGYSSENAAIAGALSAAAAMKEQNPDVKITIAVGLQQAIAGLTNIPLPDNSKKGGNQ